MTGNKDKRNYTQGKFNNVSDRQKWWVEYAQ